MSIFIDQQGNRVNIEAPFEFAGVRYQNMRDPQIRNVIGVYEIPDPIPPEDYNEKFYFKTEQDTAPFVVYTKKSDEAIIQIQWNEMNQQIDNLERSTLMPRATREFMLLNMQMIAAQAGLDPMENIGYRKVKELDDQITSLRTAMDALHTTEGQ